jgi:hypothetical protein
MSKQHGTRQVSKSLLSRPDTTSDTLPSNSRASWSNAVASSKSLVGVEEIEHIIRTLTYLVSERLDLTSVAPSESLFMLASICWKRSCSSSVLDINMRTFEKKYRELQYHALPDKYQPPGASSHWRHNLPTCVPGCRRLSLVVQPMT